MNKYAEIDKRIIMYNACKGILRVKLAAKKAPAAGTSTTKQNPGQQQAGMGGIGRSLANTAAEYFTGQTMDPNGVAGNVGEAAMNWAGKGFNAATKWMSNKGGWVGTIGNFLNKNQDKMGNIVAGANQMFRGTDQLQGAVRAKNMQQQMQMQQQQQANDQFNPDAMFAQAFQGMAQGANNMYQPQQYSGQTYRPSFA